MPTFRRNILPTSSGLKEVVCSSETLISTYKSTRRYNPEDQHRHLHRREDISKILFRVIDTSRLSEGLLILKLLNVVFPTAEVAECQRTFQDNRQ
jgi:hypothetical protein